MNPPLNLVRPTDILCYVDNQRADFTDKPLSEVWGDDWNDAPYDCNAGAPYDGTFYVFYDGEFNTPADDANGNCAYSVEWINTHAIPWLHTSSYSTEKYIAILPGITFTEFARLIELGGGQVFVPYVLGG
jgi:hypothetical protein